MIAIIFGANGQDGQFLRTLLNDNNIETVLASRSGKFIIGDISNYQFVYELIKKHKPDFIFHFAANSTTNHSVLFENHDSICKGTNNILESVRLESPHSKVFISGSAMQFENNSIPIDEKTPFSATSAYAVARICSTYTARYYRDKFNLKVYIGYFFNHDSEYRSDNHINKKIVKDLLLISEDKSIEKIQIGNPEVKKEFNFAGDIVNAVWQFISQEKTFEVVIGSGIAYSIYEWIQIVADELKVDLINIKIDVNHSFKSEYDILISNPKIIKEIGWEPKLNIRDLAKRMILKEKLCQEK